MITFKTISINTYNQENYDSDIKLIDYSNLKCSCGSIGHFHAHAKYERFFILNTEEPAVLLSIQRIKCESCDVTHALLPDIIVPYKVFSSPLIKNIILHYRNENLKLSSISKIMNISYENVKRIIKLYVTHFKERLNALQASFEVGINDDSFSFLFWNENHINFMQRIITPTVLFYPADRIPITV